MPCSLYATTEMAPHDTAGDADFCPTRFAKCPPSTDITYSVLDVFGCESVPHRNEGHRFRRQEEVVYCLQFGFKKSLFLALVCMLNHSFLPGTDSSMDYVLVF